MALDKLENQSQKEKVKFNPTTKLIDCLYYNKHKQT